LDRTNFSLQFQKGKLQEEIAKYQGKKTPQESLHFKGQILGFRPQSRKLAPPYTA